MTSRDDILRQLQAASVAPSLSKEQMLAALTAQPASNPLDEVEYTGDIVEDSAAEVDAVASAFRDRAKREDERFQLATDSEYWVALCFRTRDEKEAFLAAAGLLHLGDKYLDGHAAARVLGVEFTTND
jgi:hypothetical protein